MERRRGGRRGRRTCRSPVLGTSLLHLSEVEEKSRRALKRMVQLERVGPGRASGGGRVPLPGRDVSPERQGVPRSDSQPHDRDQLRQQTQQQQEGSPGSSSRSGAAHSSRLHHGDGGGRHGQLAAGYCGGGPQHRIRHGIASGSTTVLPRTTTTTTTSTTTTKAERLGRVVAVQICKR